MKNTKYLETLSREKLIEESRIAHKIGDWEYKDEIQAMIKSQDEFNKIADNSYADVDPTIMPDSVDGDY